MSTSTMNCSKPASNITKGLSGLLRPAEAIHSKLYTIENDNYIIDDIYVTYENVKLSWTLSATGNADKTYTFGDTVTVTAPELDPSKPDKPYYVFSKWEVVEGDLELSKDAAKEATITFEMPDSNVKLNAVYRISLKLFFKHVISVIVAFLGNAWNTVCTFIKAVLPF